MTKTQLITAVNEQLTAIITQAKVRLASLSIINSLFPAEVLQEITTGDVTCKLYYKKIGNECRVSGFIRNNTFNIIGISDLITIPNSLFFAKTGVSTPVSIPQGLVAINADKISMFGNLGAMEIFYINASYQTND